MRAPASSKRAEAAFSEKAAWQSVATGWQQLHGNFRELGVSFEWHDFKSPTALDWAKSFHPGSVEICFNLTGHGEVQCGEEKADYGDNTAGFYYRGQGNIQAVRRPQEEHRFITVEFSPDFLKANLAGQEGSLHPLVRDVVTKDKASSGLTPAIRLTSHQRDMVANLHQPPVMAAAQPLWYRSRALDLMVEFFFAAPEREFFCSRQKRVARERVDKVIDILRGQLAEPPTLEEIGKQVGCSPFYLSRTFSKEMQMTIPQYLRELRMEKASELLKSGKFNVTEVALEVGYASPSHFSAAFHQTFGCCPGLYPLVPNHGQMKKK